MSLKHFLLDVNEANAFVMACDQTKEAILIDVGEFNPAIPAFLTDHGLKLAAVFITHDHFDHTGGLAEVVDRYGVKVYAGSSRAGGCAAEELRHGGEIRVGDLFGRVLATLANTRCYL